MWPSIIPLYINNNGHLTIAIPIADHNVLTPNTVSEIYNDIHRDPRGVKNKHKNKGGSDICCLLV